MSLPGNQMKTEKEDLQSVEPVRNILWLQRNRQGSARKQRRRTTLDIASISAFLGRTGGTKRV